MCTSVKPLVLSGGRQTQNMLLILGKAELSEERTQSLWMKREDDYEMPQQN